MSRENSIEGVIDRIVYSNEETGWTVVRMVIRGRGELTAVGPLLAVRPGESVRLHGEWVRDRKYGQQFKAHSYLSVKPATYVGIEKYLGSGLVKGIGPQMAKRLVQHFGLDTLEVIENEPKRLREVEGIGPKRSQLIQEAWIEQREVKDVMVFLQGHGVSTAYAVKIYKRYGSQAVALVRENPYRLARDVYGIGFRMADKIAHDLGIPDDSEHRLSAGVLYALRQASDQGHVFVPRRDLRQQTAELLDVDADAVDAAIDRLASDKEVVQTELEEAADRAVLLPALDAAEAGVAAGLAKLTAQQQLPLRLDVGRACQWFEKQERIELAPAQRHALEQALNAKVLVLTGGPGTGKTTLVRGIVTILQAKGLRVDLAAPTGRAAKRLSEATRIEAKTVHRLLEYSPKEGGFQRHEEQPLEADLVVIDEASMLDTSLACHVLRALKEDTRLIFVGDVDQLPSVGPGRVLADLIDCGVIDVVRLSEIFRQARQSLIVMNAHRVRTGDMPQMSPPASTAGERGDFFFIDREEPEAVLSTLKLLVEERIPNGFGFAVRDIQILTPMQRGLLGAANLNAELQALLNPEGEEITRGGRLFRVGDRVMQVRNNYDLEVYNGDVGHITKIDPVDQFLRVDYEGRLVDYELSDADELVLAYACSIHKSQGSEYKAVVIPLHTQHFVMLQRNLLYTAITRGRRLVVLVGSKRALGLAVRTEQSSRRSTLLVRRLRESLGGSSGPSRPRS